MYATLSSILCLVSRVGRTDSTDSICVSRLCISKEIPGINDTGFAHRGSIFLACGLLGLPLSRFSWFQHGCMGL